MLISLNQAHLIGCGRVRLPVIGGVLAMRFILSKASRVECLLINILPYRGATYIWRHHWDDCWIL